MAKSRLVKSEGRNTSMKEVFVTVNYKNRNYITNVIVSKEMNREHIQRLAEEQVLKQWGA
jgi:hypothetical protein